jgi:hypothetical protein
MHFFLPVILIHLTQQTQWEYHIEEIHGKYQDVK